MAGNKMLLGTIAIAVSLTAVLASEKAAIVDAKSTEDQQTVNLLEEVDSRAVVGNVSGQLNPFDYTTKVSMINYGAAKAKVQQRYLFPDGVEVTSYTLKQDGYRAKRSAANQRFTQWVGGMVNLKPSEVKEADMTYINHPAQVINPSTKTFHKLSTAILIKEGDVVGGQISSPNYPLSYPDGADLTWLIAYPDGNIVKLELQDYSTEECCDRLIVYSGYNKSHNPIATFEGNYYPGSDNIVFSSSPAMFIRFTSDCLVTNRGFRATYINQPETKAPVMSCGNVQQTNSNAGYIQSPNYPGTYDQFMNCTWPVQTNYNTRVKFVMSNFSIGYDDQVEIYEGTPSYPGNKISSLSGNYYSGYTVYASTNQAFVVFTSGYSTYYSNLFLIAYEGAFNSPETTTSAPMSCGYVHTSGGSSGYFESPNYPGTYIPNMNCTWSVQTYYNTRVKFVLNNFYIGSDDKLEFYDGTPSYPGYRITYLTGTSGSYYTIYATSNQAFAVFTSGYSTYYSNKFYVSYSGDNVPTTTYDSPDETTAVYYYDPSQCGNSSYSQSYSSAYIYSPGYYSPGNYPLNDYCIWYVTTSSYYDAVRFYPIVFSTEYGYDWVRIYNSHSTSSSNQIVQISGYVDPYTTLAVSNSRYATMTFSSDYVFTDRGFKIYYYGTYYSNYNDYTTASPVEATTSMNTCGDLYYGGSSGYVQSPNYPNNYYNSMNCSTWIYTPYGTTVMLTVQSFNLASGDYVYIYDGYNGNYLGYFSGYDSYGYTWYSSTNYIQIAFISDSYYTSSGYSLRYDAVYNSYYTTQSPSTSSCGGSTPYNNGSISSPGYPYYSYSNNLDCVWTFQVYPDKYVLFTIETFQTESCCDYVSFYKGSPNNSSGRYARLNGYVSPGYEVLVPDYNAYIIFDTDVSVTDNGFKINYQPVPTYYTGNGAVTAGYDDISQPYREARKEVKAETEKGPRTLGRDLWVNAKNKPEHLRRIKEQLSSQEKREQEETLN